MSRDFDPRRHVRTLADGRQYIDVKWRVKFLRSRHPDASIETQVIETAADRVIAKAIIRLPGGGTATGHASHTGRETDGDIVQRVETSAIGRALELLGYGIDFAAEDDIQVTPADPVEAPGITPFPVGRPPQSTGSPPSGAAEDPEDFDESPPDLPDGLTPGRDAFRRGPDDSAAWARFWEWAQPRGYTSVQQLSELLGVDISEMSIAEVRRLIRRHELDDPIV